MAKIIILFKKELSFYFNNPIGYIAVILFAVFANYLFIRDLFIRGSGSMRPFFDMAAWLMVIFVPALSMRLFSEEKRTNTIEVLLTLPVTEMEIITAKFLAVATMIAISLSLTLSLPVTLMTISQIGLGGTITSYLGLMLLSVAFCAVSLFFSDLTPNQLAAFLGSLAAIFLFYTFGSDLASTWIPTGVRESVLFLSPVYQYESFIRGLVDIGSILYFLSIIIVFLFLTLFSLKNRRG